MKNSIEIYSMPDMYRAILNEAIPAKAIPRIVAAATSVYINAPRNKEEREQLIADLRVFFDKWGTNAELPLFPDI